MLRQLVIGIVICFALTAARAENPQTLSNLQWTITIDPQTLAVSAKPGMQLSAPRPPMQIADLQHDASHVQWNIPAEQLNVSMKLAGDALEVEFESAKAGSLTWPIVPPDTAIKAIILPNFEGSYIPADDAQWAAALVKEGPMSTTEMAMPFWGVDLGGRTITFIAVNPYNNQLEFAPENGRLVAKLTHEFTANQKIKKFAVRVSLGGASPIEPAKEYRKFLLARGEFVSMKEKIAHTPDAAKLLGAAHAYLWGDDLFTRHDAKDFKSLATKFLASDLKNLLTNDARKTFEDASTMQFVDAYTRRVMAEEISRIISVPEAKKVFLEKFADVINPPETWGDGVSPKMVKQLSGGGLDRLWLGAAGWKGLQQRPDTVTKAKELGYLIGPYDSYESIHSPKAADTWETAQFDQALYESGAVVQANGEKKHGFQKKGFALSPIAARPYVENRVKMLMGQFAANSWFMDCDAFGDLKDDYSPLHPATQADDLAARLSRMAWIRDTFGCVIGSEGGSACAAGTIHFAHGMTTPVIGWGDPDMNSKTSPYYTGAYYPPDAPTAFFKQIPLKDEYQRVFIDPRFRLPLFETVFHDSVVATHHWSAGSLRFKDDNHVRELTELLYNTPPLYHLNLEEWKKCAGEIKSHYAFFSPLHRETGTLAMTDFAWLSEDRMVQRTQFGDEIEMIVNFGSEPFTSDGKTIAAKSVVARWLKTERMVEYTPAN